KAPRKVPAGDAPQRAAGGPKDNRRERDEQRRASAVDHAAQRVASDLVGAERVLRAGRLVHRAEVGLERVIGREQRRGDGDEDDEQPDRAAQGGQRVVAREGGERGQHGGARQGGGDDGGRRRGGAHSHQEWRMRGSSHAYERSTSTLTATKITA